MDLVSYPARVEGLVNMVMLSIKLRGTKCHFLVFGKTQPRNLGLPRHGEYSNRYAKFR